VNEIKPIVQGRHLIDVFGLSPSKQFGVILKEVFKAQIDGIFDTLEGGLEFTKGVIYNLE
jgi:tRNA nucleotidyltransferase (CCA-adding enzyme)